MASLPPPRRAFWGDVRFLVGIALVALSIAGVWLIVSASDHAVPALQATRTIAQGEELTSSDFQVVDVGLGSLADDYLGPEDVRPGSVAARTLQSGELVPTSALTDADSSRSTTVVIQSSTGIPEGVEAGTVVEIWQAPPLDEGRSYDVPRILVADVIVHDVLDQEGVLADTGSQLEVVIDRADVADVLAAITGGAALSVVPVGSGS
ncbi:MULTISPECIES: SAF domain-containing protein [unclassified Microbacterium]|uniref:SAF domain-containing protein n=1 Tax=unclassified Microbacterium TaxID=2609290 RepID=UPI00049362A6|nr:MULTISPECIES: SAF domain-containing protein [unclassified Microbacterium]MCV0333206.1 SAF domain-containing protein [Microbacterium sp.]MCV0375651.1 SAF domain-containing protein [Microbacterium sp.]MCV0388994.1 SAF domain-containing protein [Microbacterium sp.]MCV0417522.1 SAF domain-containing protein [Microbacterium sp.]MCV0420833.1 SAF domain-containing protein [Microbacterium sp.]